MIFPKFQEVRLHLSGEELLNKNDKVGLLLDLSKGTLDLYLNGNYEGTKASGLSGHYCWAVRVWGAVKIRQVHVPASIGSILPMRFHLSA